LPFGKANVLQEIWKQDNTETMTIITYGMGTHWAMNASQGQRKNIEIIDLRTLAPLDEETIITSVKKTGKCLVVTEEPVNNSFARALCGMIQEKCFKYLDAPVMIIGSENMPAIPLNSTLEQTMIPSTEKVKAKIEELMNY
jgi:2-oxoisovalerate dehydrogenase E1 component